MKKFSLVMAALIGVFILALSSCGGSVGGSGGNNDGGDIDSKANLKITISQINDISFDYEVSSENILSLTADSSFSNYKWTFDGESISANENSNRAEVDLNDYESGYYVLFLTAEKNGLMFSTDSIISF